MWRETQEKVELEIAQLHHLVDVHRDLIQRAADVEPNAVELSAISAYLHSFYNGVENVLKRIAADIDRIRLSTDQWHIDLLRTMAAATSDRPALISDVLLGKLSAYMGFRHVFRHSYTFDLKWRKMETLALESEDVLEEFAKACGQFFES